eukprot:GHUV01039245.1.p1 GENE.GHUV01039245.1~~GHUV01039245.1.p1  ORF type:complete len:308 (+),score=69.36 GHUV01039245.1:63-986(+)
MDLLCYVCGARSLAGRYEAVEDIDAGPVCPECGAGGFVELVQPRQAHGGTGNVTAQRYSSEQGNSVSSSGMRASAARGRRSPETAPPTDDVPGQGGQLQPSAASDQPAAAVTQPSDASPRPLVMSVLDGLLLHLNGHSRPTSRAALEALPRLVVPNTSANSSDSTSAREQQQIALDIQHSIQEQPQQIEALEAQPGILQQQVLQDVADLAQQQQHTADLAATVVLSSSISTSVRAFCTAGEPCTICHEEFQAGSEVVQLPCKHCFHEVGCVGWLVTATVWCSFVHVLVHCTALTAGVSTVCSTSLIW